MLRLRNLLNASLRTKVLVPVTVCMAVLIALSLLIVNRRVSQQFQDDGRQNLTTADSEFRFLQKNRSDDLLARFRHLPNEPRYRAAFQLGDAPTLHQPLSDLLGEQGADIVFYATGSGKVLATEKSDPAISSEEFETAAALATRRALDGQETVDTVRAGRRLYNVVSIPVYVDSGLIGALTLGLDIGDSEAQKFSLLTHSQIALVAGGQVVAATLSGPDVNAQSLEIFTNLPASSEAGELPEHLKQIEVEGQHYFGLPGHFESLAGDGSLGYVLLSSYEPSLRALQSTQRMLLAVSLCAILLGAAIVWWLTSKATRPLRELRDSVEAVGRGDLSRQVEVKSADECGELALVYNRMTENLRRSGEQLEKAHAEVVESSRLAGMAEVATSVLHNVRNVLTSVNIASSLMAEGLKRSKAGNLAKIVVMLEEHRDNLGSFLTNDPEGAQVIDYLRQLSSHLEGEQTAILGGLAQLQKGIEHIMDIVKAQQSYAKISGTAETLKAADLVEDALKMNSIRKGAIQVTKEISPDLSVTVEKHKALQILVNLIRNARQSCETSSAPTKTISVRGSNGGDYVRISVTDNGVGIAPGNLNRIFAHGFTTKKDGHGFGLHNSLMVAKEMGGDLRVQSEGPGKGATFTLELPLKPDGSDRN